MSTLELPHTPGCLVCGRANPNGLRLSLSVHPETGLVTVPFTPQPHHVGFEGIIHGGLLATVLDEAMVWAATWSGRRFCVCGEMTVRFRHSAPIGQTLTCTARIASSRRGLIETTGEVRTADGTLVCTATGKYVPVDDDRDAAFKATIIDEPATRPAAAMLTRGIPMDAKD
jgi:uncharacterized protein (TIGR00369 family)